MVVTTTGACEVTVCPSGSVTVVKLSLAASHDRGVVLQTHTKLVDWTTEPDELEVGWALLAAALEPAGLEVG